MSEGGKNDEFLLGKISATVSGTADDVRMIRSELGSVGTRLGMVEKHVAEIQAERAVMIPEYKSFVTKTRNSLEVLETWKSGIEGAGRGLKLAGGWVWLAIGLIGGTGAAALLKTALGL